MSRMSKLTEMGTTLWVIVFSLLIGACSANNADPATVLDEYVAAYNSGDVDAVMEFFTEDSVVTGHPFDALQNGLTEIRAVTVKDIDAAADDNAYTISNVQVKGGTVTWDHIWINNEGDEFCKFGHSALIDDGKIMSWTWPGGGFDCP